MTTIPISDGDPKNTYTAAAAQTIFPYTFWVREEGDIDVYVNSTLRRLLPITLCLLSNQRRAQTLCLTLGYQRMT